ncbi:hypothetical protein D8674_026346 [Pyrus ussuriensis x Pyrus communis]|uniref:Uncharacterized protein n=1 Tax=Pyrus ussuriensis x Pyrus communis TaxID=2448454 RepID=A0A5N5IBD2_9ROSA|nr:hypothetical protein D8674_026346 [Pyrus ussuriensis x Pyrus communis]
MMWFSGGEHQHRVGDLGGGSSGCSDAGGGDALVGDCLVVVVHRDGDRETFLKKGEGNKRLVGPKAQYVLFFNS